MTHLSRRGRLPVSALLLLPVALTAAVGAQPATPTRPHHPDTPYQSPTSLGAASYAKILCSAVFVSGRDADEARQNSAYFLMPERTAPSRSRSTSTGRRKRVRVTLRGTTRTAAFYGDQGCVIHPGGRGPRILHADAGQEHAARCRQSSRGRWAMRRRRRRGRPGLDRARVQAAVDLAFADPDGLTAAVVVVHQGQIVGERYMAGITPGHAARELVDGQEPHRDAGRSRDRARLVRARRPGAGAGLAAAGRSARRHPRARRDADVERAELHRAGRSAPRSDDAVPRSLLHLCRGRQRLRLCHVVAGRSLRPAWSAAIATPIR